MLSSCPEVTSFDRDCRDASNGGLEARFSPVTTLLHAVFPRSCERGDALAGRRKRLVQRRFERMGCPTAINGLHRDFQGPIHAREMPLGDLLAEQGFDRGR